MCGIAGIYSFGTAPVTESDMCAMTEALSHRGPDGAGLRLDRNVALGHRRLAVIDLTKSASQPMENEDGSLLLTYNGEIYNFAELRTQLETAGHLFKSRSDSEVILHAYEEWREDCLPLFNGVFAFAIYDKTRREIFIARDRYGARPLYYLIGNNHLLFASEQKAILRHPACSTQVDVEALAEYFTFQNIFTDKTLLLGIRVFPAGNWSRIFTDRPLDELALKRYWDFDFCSPDNSMDEASCVEEIDRLFQQAVRRQLVSDVDLGTYLSGGIDSGAITAVAVQSMPYIKSFTCGFDLHSASGIEMAFDEREAAELMSYLFRTEHYEMVLKAGDMERILPSLAWHIEEPRVGQSYPNFYVSRLASKFVRVCLSGTGSDELFGGYPWRYYRTLHSRDFEHYINEYYHYWNRLMPNRLIKQALAPIWASVRHVDTRDIFRSVFQSHANQLTTTEDFINHSLYFEAKTFLHGLLLIEDKIGMAHGLETRVPFLDNDLVDFAMRVPVGFKLRDPGQSIRMDENEPGRKTEVYYRRNQEGKMILRRMLRKYVPAEISESCKQGFSAPDASWFRGESIDYVRNFINDDDLKLYQYLDKNVVRNLLKEHFDGRENRRLLIWSILNVEWWMRHYT